MPRRPRFSTGNYVFHVLNRSVGGKTIFDTEYDYLAFTKVLQEARSKAKCRLLSFCIMPNHWHLIVWPRRDEDLSEYFRWLTVTHTQRWHAFHGTTGTGPLYQGRFKSFPVQADSHFYTVCRYVERNALRAGLVKRAENWRWGSLWQRRNPPGDVAQDCWPLKRPSNWTTLVNEPQTEAEICSLRKSLQRGAPYGNSGWMARTANKLKLEQSLRPKGRPRKRV